MKFIRVNLTTKSIDTHDVPEEYVGLGGRALTSSLINNEVPATCDPLGSENKLVFAPGYLSGTPLVNTSRLSIGAKSPLTHGIRMSDTIRSTSSNSCLIRCRNHPKFLFHP